MGIEKINIEKDKFDINLKFYFILKYLTKANLNSNDINKILELNIKNLTLNRRLNTSL